MSLAVSVVIPTSASLDLRTLKSVDRQSLPPTEFEVLLLAPGVTASRDRLDQLAANRPNVRVLGSGDDDGRAALEAAAGRYLLPLGPGVVLGDQSLERLCAFADESSADICFAKTSQPGDRPASADLFVVNQPRADKDDLLLGSAATPTMYRTGFLRDAGLPVDLTADGAEPAAAALAATDRVAVLADYPAFLLRGRAAAAETATPPSPLDADARWSDGALDLSVTLRLPAGGQADDLAVRVGVFRAGDGTEWLVPDKEVQLDQDRAQDGVLTVRSTVRPGTLAGGDALPRGTWRLVLVLGGRGRSQRVAVPAAKGFRQVALCDGTLVVCHHEDGGLSLDVGARKRPVVFRIAAEDTSVVETARGSLLTAPVPDVQLPAGTRIDGQLRIGGLPVPAALEADGKATTLSAFVSGLPGSYPLATKFSKAPFAGARVSLEVDGDGTMTVRETAAPRPAGSKRPGGPGTAAPAAAPAARSRLRRVAKRVPGAAALYHRVRG